MKKEMSLPVSVLDCGRVSASRPSLFAAFKAFMLRSAPVLFLASFYGRLLEMRVTLRVGTALWLGLQALCRLIPVLLQYKKKAVQ